MKIDSRKRLLLTFLLTVALTQNINCSKSNSNWWFNIHLHQVKQTCDDRGTTFFDDLLKSLSRFREKCKIKYAEIETEVWKSNSNITMKYMLRKQCYDDPTIKTALLKVANNVQLCLKKKKRLKKSNKKMMMERMFDAVCSMMELKFLFTPSARITFKAKNVCLNKFSNFITLPWKQSNISRLKVFISHIFYNAVTPCEEILRKDAGFNKCYERFPNVWPSHSFWPIPLIYPNQVCNERKGLKECQMEVVNDCIPFTWYTHASFNSLLDKAWSSIFCNNMV